MTSLNHHRQIFKCKEIHEYLRNTTCSDHEVFEVTNPGLISRMWKIRSAELIQMMIYGVTWIVEPFVPVFSYITDVAVDLYFGFLHGKSTLLRIEFPLHKLAWQER